MPGPERHRSLNPRVALKSTLKKEAYQEKFSLANDFSEDEFGDLRSADGSGESSAHGGGGSGSTGSSAGGMNFVKRIKQGIDKGLHLELFGVTWFDFAAISCARWMFVIVLLAAAAGLAIGVYTRLRDEETQNFESEVRRRMCMLCVI
jgi:hypothetical protein